MGAPAIVLDQLKGWWDASRADHLVPGSGSMSPVHDLSGQGNDGTLAAAMTSVALTNYLLDPSFELDSNSDGLADNWTFEHTGINGTVTPSIVTGRTKGNAQRIQYTGHASDSGATLRIRSQTATDSFAATYPAAAAIYIKGSVSGCTVSAQINAYKSDGTYLQQPVAVNITPTGAFVFTPINPTLTDSMPALTSYVRLYIAVSGIDPGDTVDITLDDAILVKNTICPAYGDGSWTDWSWSGAANASSSTHTFKKELGWGGQGTPTNPWAMQGDGVLGVVTLPDMGTAENWECTFEAWVRTPATPPQSTQYLAALSEAGPVVTSYPLVMLGIASSGTGKAMWYVRDGDNHTKNMQSASNICDGGVHHLVGTINAANSRGYFYLDRAVAYSWTSGYNLNACAMTGGWIMGSGTNGTQYRWPSEVLVARKYSKALSQAEAFQNYDAGYMWYGVPPLMASHRRRRT